MKFGGGTGFAFRWRQHVVIVAISLTVVSLPVRAQQDSAPPPPGTRYTSMGQPPWVKPYAGAVVDVQTTGTNLWGGNAFLGAYKDLLPAAVGLGVAAEGYLGGVPQGVDGGLRAFLAAPVIYLQFGIDWNLRVDRVQYIMSAIVPLSRGGLFHAGGQVRADWIPAREQTFNLGVQFPFGRWNGKTRPYGIGAPLPRGRAPAPTRVDSSIAGLPEALAQLQESADWVYRISFVFPTSDGDHLQEVADTTRAVAQDFLSALVARNRARGGTPGAAGEFALYHHLLDVVFGLAAGVTDSAHARRIANQARAAMFDEVLVPYDLKIGQYKKNDDLWGLGTVARTRFEAAITADGSVSPGQRAAVLSVFDAWLSMLDAMRADRRKTSGDARMVWMPLVLSITPDKHDTQAELDSIIGTAVGRPFTTGNEIAYINGQQATAEFPKSILDAKDYHVLWIHDYRGLNHAGEPDEVGYSATVDGYLTALLNAVRQYDVAGKLPVFIIMLDQNYYDANGSRLWLSLLEKPLTHRIRLPSAYAAWEDRIEQVQDSLRMAVASSARLQSDARRAAGSGARRWIENRVKVQVNVTNPADLSFRSRHLLGLPFAGDVLMRDHRKIAFRDLTPDDPGIGEAMYTGIGIGQWYASETWEDRAIIARGPVALYTRDAARTVLEQQGFKPDEIPEPLRQRPLPPDYPEMVEALVKRGWTADALLTVNQTGFYPKDASFAQMALYDLMPSGSVMWVPDSIWNDLLWISQLVAAALRGCEVFVVAPAQANAPSAAPMTLTRTDDMFTRLLALQEVLRPTIEEAGGDLRVGLYTRTSEIGIPEDKLRENSATYRQDDFLRRLFPFPESIYRLLDVAADTMAALELGREDLIESRVDRLPNLHRKTQFFATRETLDSLAHSPVIDSVMREVLVQWATGVTVDPGAYQGVQAQTMVRGYERLPAELRRRAVLFMTVGSLNKDTRGLALDGESMFITSGAWALAAYTDFFFLFGSVTWLENQAQLEQLMGSYSGLDRWMGRRLKRIL